MQNMRRACGRIVIPVSMEVLLSCKTELDVFVEAGRFLQTRSSYLPAHIVSTVLEQLFCVASVVRCVAAPALSWDPAYPAPRIDPFLAELDLFARHKSNNNTVNSSGQLKGKTALSALLLRAVNALLTISCSPDWR